MALGAVLAAALTDHAVRTKALWLDGLDIIKQPGTGTLYGVGIETITNTEQGPGGVSSLSFDIDDPSNVVTLRVGATVLFQDITRDKPIFRGWVQHWRMMPAFGQRGRLTHVECVGVEIVLDWTIIGSETRPAGETVQAAIQALARDLQGASVLGGPPPAGTESFGTDTEGIGDFFGRTLDNSVTITGATLRDAIATLAANSNATVLGWPVRDLGVTVDMYGIVRVWPWLDGAGGPAVPGAAWYISNTFQDTGVATKTADLIYEIDPTAVVRAVYIAGANAAGTGWISDGSGIVGRKAYISDTSSDSATKLSNIGRTYLDQFSIAQRGSFSWSPPQASNRDMIGGTTLDLANLPLGLSGGAGFVYRVFTIDRTFYPSGEELQRISYGALQPSASALTRRLTRSTLS